jgi:hypothetical protein
MGAKALLISAFCATALIGSVADDGRLGAAKSPGIVVAQAWWDAAYNAANAQRQAAPVARSENRRYRR